ncbi:MAG: glycosyltransferase family 4 protein [Clostridium sp.]
MKKFKLFLSDINNDMLTKDVGIIPYIMQKYYGYESSIITRKKQPGIIDNEIYLENMPVNLIPNSETWIQELLETDVLMMIGLYGFNLEMINIYRQFKPNGKLYLKLDANRYWMSRVVNEISQENLEILKKCDLITVEDSSISQLLNSRLGLDTKVVVNGYFDYVPERLVEYEEKENKIIFVGRVGAPEKVNQNLVEAFRLVEDKLDGWKVELVGGVTPEFKQYMDNIFAAFPSLQSKILMPGKFAKKDLKEKYEKGKVFCLTSTCEGCPNVFSEAISNGCYLISSDVDSVRDLIDHGKYGRVLPSNTPVELSKALLEVCLDEELLKNNCILSQQYAKENLKWEVICKKINDYLI